MARRAAQTWPASDLQEEIVGILKRGSHDFRYHVADALVRMHNPAAPLRRPRSRPAGWRNPRPRKPPRPPPPQDGAATDPDIVVTGSR
jgi:hypothetical protein